MREVNQSCARCSHVSGGCSRCGRTTGALLPAAGRYYCDDPIQAHDWDATCHSIVERILEDEEEAYRDRRARFIQLRNERIQRIHDSNVVATPGHLGEVLALHAPQWPEVTESSKDVPWATRPDCSGCEFSGYEAEAPYWPCKTYRIAARHLTR